MDTTQACSLIAYEDAGERFIEELHGGHSKEGKLESKKVQVPGDRASERRDYRPIHVNGDVSRAIVHTGWQAALRRGQKQTQGVQGPFCGVTHLILTDPAL